MTNSAMPELFPRSKFVPVVPVAKHKGRSHLFAHGESVCGRQRWRVGMSVVDACEEQVTCFYCRHHIKRLQSKGLLCPDPSIESR